VYEDTLNRTLHDQQSAAVTITWETDDDEIRTQHGVLVLPEQDIDDGIAMIHLAPHLKSTVFTPIMARTIRQIVRVGDDAVTWPTTPRAVPVPLPERETYAEYVW
jgi:hypothetical protein